jgi:hypothetical protein
MDRDEMVEELRDAMLASGWGQHRCNVLPTLNYEQLETFYLFCAQVDADVYLRGFDAGYSQCKEANRA